MNAFEVMRVAAAAAAATVPTHGPHAHVHAPKVPPQPKVVLHALDQRSLCDPSDMMRLARGFQVPDELATTRPAKRVCVEHETVWKTARVAWRKVLCDTAAPGLLIFPECLVDIPKEIEICRPLDEGVVSTLLSSFGSAPTLRDSLPEAGEHLIRAAGEVLVNPCDETTLAPLMAALVPGTDHRLRVDDGSVSNASNAEVLPFYTQVALPSRGMNFAGPVCVVVTIKNRAIPPQWDECLSEMHLPPNKQTPLCTTCPVDATRATVEYCSQQIGSARHATAWRITTMVLSALRAKLPKTARTSLRLHCDMPVGDATKTLRLQCGPFEDHEFFHRIVRDVVLDKLKCGKVSLNPPYDVRTAQLALVAWFADDDADGFRIVPAAHFFAANAYPSKESLTKFMTSAEAPVTQPLPTPTQSVLTSTTANNAMAVVSPYGAYTTSAHLHFKLNSALGKKDPMLALCSAAVLVTHGLATPLPLCADAHVRIAQGNHVTVKWNNVRFAKLPFLARHQDKELKAPPTSPVVMGSPPPPPPPTPPKDSDASLGKSHKRGREAKPKPSSASGPPPPYVVELDVAFVGAACMTVSVTMQKEPGHTSKSGKPIVEKWYARVGGLKVQRRCDGHAEALLYEMMEGIDELKAHAALVRGVHGY